MPDKPELNDPDDEKPILPNSPAEWELETGAFHYANDPNLPDDVRNYIRDLWRQFVLREDVMVEPIERRLIDATPCVYCGYALEHYMLSGPSRFHLDTYEASVECGRCRSQSPNVNGQTTLDEAEDLALKAWSKPTKALNAIMERRMSRQHPAPVQKAAPAKFTLPTSISQYFKT
jgi:hypothetical protein